MTMLNRPMESELQSDPCAGEEEKVVEMAAKKIYVAVKKISRLCSQALRMLEQQKSPIPARLCNRPNSRIYR